MNYQILAIGFVLKIIVFNYSLVFAEISEPKKSSELISGSNIEREDLLVAHIREKRQNVNQVHVHVHINNGEKEKDVDNNSIKPGDRDFDEDDRVDDSEDDRRERRRRKKKTKKNRKRCRKYDKRKKCRRHKTTTPSTIFNSTEISSTDQVVATDNIAQSSTYSSFTTNGVDYTSPYLSPTPGEFSPGTSPESTEYTVSSPAPSTQSIPYYPPTEVTTPSPEVNTISDKDIQMRKSEDEKHIVRDVK